MRFISRIVNAMSRRETRPPRPGVLLRRRKEDSVRDYPADGLTPQGLIAIFREADGGSLSSQMTLYEQMEEKDAHLYSVANTRRLAITGLPWKIVSAAEMPNWRGDGTTGGRQLADKAARYCEDVLRRLDGFEESLLHLSLALGRNIAMVELVWEATREGLRLSALEPVDFNRLVTGDRDDIRVLTEAAPRDGIALPPSKFITHVPNSLSAHPMRGGLSRVTALAYLGKHFAIKDWLVFAEVFGMPVRIARYAPNATPEEKRELLEMLQQLGADATGIFSKAVEIQIQQTRMPGETNLYENLCLYFDREISKAWLGQTLTTDTIRSRASAGAAVVHDRVRRDIRDDDLRKEAQTLRRDLLAPLVRFQFGASAPVPHFRRISDRRFEPDELAKLLSIAVNDLGAKVPQRWAHTALGVPQAEASEAILPGRTASKELSEARASEQ